MFVKTVVLGVTPAITTLVLSTEAICFICSGVSERNRCGFAGSMPSNRKFSNSFVTYVSSVLCQDCSRAMRMTAER